jgi:hypothetical protein
MGPGNGLALACGGDQDVIEVRSGAALGKAGAFLDPTKRGLGVQSVSAMAGESLQREVQRRPCAIRGEGGRLLHRVAHAAHGFDLARRAA